MWTPIQVHDKSTYTVGMLASEDTIKLSDNYYSFLVQLKWLQNLLAIDPHLMSQLSKIIEDPRYSP